MLNKSLSGIRRGLTDCRCSHSEASCGGSAQRAWRDLTRLGHGLLSCFLLSASIMGSRADSFYVDYSKTIEIADVLAHPESILHPTVDLDIPELIDAGHSPLGYLSVGEIAADAVYRGRAIASGVKRPMKNAVWNSEVVDLSDDAWRTFVVSELGQEIVDRGFSGFFLDTMDAVDLLSAQNPERTDEYREGLIALVKSLRETFPAKKIVVNRGFSVLDAIRDSIDGVLVESVFGTFQHDTAEYFDVKESDTTALLGLLRPLRDSGKSVYVLDYASPDTVARAQDLAQRALAEGFHSLVSTSALNGLVLAPFRKIPRKVLVLYGSDPSQGPWAPRYPFDSSTFLRFPDSTS